MHKTILLLLAITGCTATPAAAAPTFPDRVGAGVVDAANVIPPAAERVLNEKVVAWNKATRHQLVVATVPSLHGYDIKDYGYQLLRTWGLGRKGVNDGVVLLLAPTERKVRIEVGYGLEPTLTDALTSQIIRSAIVPELKAGDNVAALNAGADQIMANAKTEERAMTPVDRRSNAGWLWLVALAALLGGGVWMVIARSARRTRERERAAEAERRRAARRSRTTPSPTHVAPAPVDIPVRPVRHVPPTPPFTGSRPVAQRRDDPIERVIPAVATFPAYSPPPPPPPSPSYSSDWGSSSSSSSDSSSSSSSFDSGGGSCGGGGSDSSY